MIIDFTDINPNPILLMNVLFSSAMNSLFFLVGSFYYVSGTRYCRESNMLLLLILLLLLLLLLLLVLLLLLLLLPLWIIIVFHHVYFYPLIMITNCHLNHVLTHTTSISAHRVISTCPAILLCGRQRCGQHTDLWCTCQPPRLLRYLSI